MKISVETTVAAPIEQVWRAYTTPEDIKQWNAASDDWHTTAATVDLRVGGAFSSRMEAKDGSMGFDFAGTYTKIVELIDEFRIWIFPLVLGQGKRVFENGVPPRGLSPRGRRR